MVAQAQGAMIARRPDDVTAPSHAELALRMAIFRLHDLTTSCNMADIG
jgi:hypothetical protein